MGAPHACRRRGRLVLFFMLCVFVTPNLATADTLSFQDLLSQTRPTATRKLAYGTESDQFGELYLPETSTSHPVLVMIHGGCWQENLPGVDLTAYLSDDLRRSGVAVWNIEYRRLGASGGGYPGTFQDVANAIEFLRQISPKYNLDLSKLVLVGHSAGGELALFAAAQGRLPLSSSLHNDKALPIKAVVTLAGINDLAAYRLHGPSACGGPRTIDRLVIASGHDEPDAYADTSPKAFLPLGIHQIVVSGSLDPIVPAKFGEDYGQAAKSSGDNVDIIEIPNAGHFELIDPHSAAWWRIVKPALLALLK